MGWSPPWLPLLLLVAAWGHSPAGARRPHIILIIADDLGWNDVGAHGSQLAPTPHVDALAVAGRVLRRHYTLPTCTPSRAALLAGRHAAATGMQGFPLRCGEPRGLPLAESTLAEHLHARSYATHLVGKWHLGAHHAAFLPTRRGFDSHFGYRNGYVGYFDHRIQQTYSCEQKSHRMAGQDLWRGEAAAEEGVAGEYLTHAFTREAVRVIKEHAAGPGKGPGGQPLFLQLAQLAVHTGNDSIRLEVPDVNAAHSRFAYEPDPERRLYAEMLRQLDASVGSVLGALRDTAMLNDSIVVFISDNGAITTGLHYNTGSNWPLRGAKHTLFEGGVRTVGAVWSRRLRALRRPYDHPLHVSDWAATLLAAADEDEDEDEVKDEDASDPFAGVSHWEALAAPAEEKVESPRNVTLLNVDDVIGHSGIMEGIWKYVEGSHQDGSLDGHLGSPARGEGYPGVHEAAEAAAAAAKELGLDESLSAADVLQLREDTAVSCNDLQDTLGPVKPCAAGCLFDLEADPCEMRDVSALHPAIRERLRAQLEAFRAQQAAQLNAPVDPRADPRLHGGLWTPWLDELPAGAEADVAALCSGAVRALGPAATIATIAAVFVGVATTAARL